MYEALKAAGYTDEEILEPEEEEEEEDEDADATALQDGYEAEEEKEGADEEKGLGSGKAGRVDAQKSEATVKEPGPSGKQVGF
jgi:hypothetical protein